MLSKNPVFCLSLGLSIEMHRQLLLKQSRNGVDFDAD
jgi:hypothetical protein